MLNHSLNDAGIAPRNLQSLALARLLILLLGQTLVLANLLWLELPFWYLPVQSALALYGLAIALLFWRIKRSTAFSQPEVLAHLITDALLMTAFFQFTGGPINPFASLLLFPQVISAVLLRPRFSWMMVVVSICCYATLFAPSDLDLLLTEEAHNGHFVVTPSIFSMHMIGMWLNFVVTAILINVFAVTISQYLRRQQQQLARQRETALRDEQLVGIATQAASAAHHMGTPLSTMVILIQDLKAELASASQQEDLALIEQQLAQCRTALEGLRNAAQQAQNKQTGLAEASAQLTLIADEFRVLRPGVALEMQLRLSAKTTMSDSPSLRMALLNLLNNSADAGATTVTLRADEADEALVIDIVDNGEGFADSYRLSAETPTESSKSSGMGLGLFLSHATFSRFHGTMKLMDNAQSGCHIQVRLPLSSDPTP